MPGIGHQIDMMDTVFAEQSSGIGRVFSSGVAALFGPGYGGAAVSAAPLPGRRS
jgi:hypothetical protein